MTENRTTQPNKIYRVERDQHGEVTAWTGEPGVDTFSTPLIPRVWWRGFASAECDRFDTGTLNLGSYILAHSILAEHLGPHSAIDQATWMMFHKTVIDRLPLKPGQHYEIDTFFLLDWLTFYTQISTRLAAVRAERDRNALTTTAV